MNFIAILLYLIGFMGICISLVLLIFKFHRKINSLKIITVTIIMLSFVFFSVSILLSILNINTSTHNQYDNITTLAPISIKNTTKYSFSGTVKISFISDTAPKASIVSLPVKNLLPKCGNDTTILDNNIKYEFLGDSKENYINNNNNNNNYTIDNITIVNGYIRFKLFIINNSIASIEEICSEFRKLYPKEICSGFLIYFLNNSNSKSTSPFAGFYCDNINDKRHLSTYSHNKKKLGF